MIGDVGVVVEKFGNKVIVVGGILFQRMFFCLDFMDQFFCQFKLVVFSFVLVLVLMKVGGLEIEVERILMEFVLRVLGKINKNMELNFI